VPIHRAVFTALPLKGDYVLSPTGYSWNVRQSNGDGSVRSILAGVRDRTLARERLMALAGADKTDAWEIAGADLFRLVAAFRPSAAIGRED
jgi:hypothetical protein